MADELNKSAEFTGKHQDEENPILIAQRYLNIYRQIHIFNKKRQDQFDDSLIEMAPDIRILLSTLPGGSLLLEHITELEEKRGIIPNALLDTEIAENKKADKEEKVLSSSKTNGKNSDNGTLPNNLVKVLQKNEEKHAKDLQALTDAFLKSQENMAEILRQALNIRSAEENERIEETSVKESEKTSTKESKENKKTKENKKAKQIEEIKDIPEATDVPETKEQRTSTEETHKSETTSRILSFTKKLFSGHKSAAAETEKQDIPPIIDTTPVSLDEIESEPISLDLPDSEPLLSDTDTPQMPVQEKSDEQPSADDEDDWEWEYVDEDENVQAEDDEWEYVEEDGNTPSNDDDEWEYVEDEAPASPTTENVQAEPLEDEAPTALEDNQMTYTDNIAPDNNTLPEGQQWDYTEDGANILPEDLQWDNVEDGANILPEGLQWDNAEDGTNILPDGLQWDNAEDGANILPEDQQWNYSEDGTNILPEDQQWNYSEDGTNILPEGMQWDNTEDPNADYTYQYPAEDQQGEHPEDSDVALLDDKSQS